MHVGKLKIASILVVFVSHLTVAQIIPRNANIVAGEYFIDIDPGEGRATPLTINFVSTAVEIDIANVALPIGKTLFVRFKDSNGKWSAPRGVVFNGQAFNRDQNVTYAEYFIGSDPGVGKGTQVSITSGLTTPLEIQNINLSQGQNVFVRVRDSENRWSAPTAIRYPSQIIRAAEVLVGGNPANVQPGTGTPMTAVDGSFDSAVEEVEATLSSWNRTDTIWVRVQNSDYLWSLAIGDIKNPAPILVSLSPTRAGRGSSLDVTLNGSNFISETVVSFGQQVTVNSVTLKSASQLVANITILSTATTGPRTVTVTNPPPGGGTDSLSNAFTIDTSPPVSVESGIEIVPEQFNLFQNYPNPFNPKTTIEFDLPRRSFVKLTLLNLLGQELKTLVNQELRAGRHRVIFNASNLPSGVYFYRLSADGFVQTKKLILLK